jgi:tRNA A-37 threonylcarbamoyl transferase component Bud32/tetratricopeptide (TPR) repeat protein
LSDAAARLAAALADRYRVERELGQGGMATVYLAHDLRHERQVAVKVLRPELAAVIGAERFVQEIRTTAALQHPNILPLFDSGEAAGFLYYVMPFLPGPSLRDRLAREGQLGVAEALAITREVAGARAAAHAPRLVHRDVKPDNIMFSAGQAVVADFGIARALDAAAGQQLTLTGMAIGTPAYMSPEQSVGEPGVDARSDLYSLATVLYEMLAGEPPFTGHTAAAIIARRLGSPTPEVRIVRRSVPHVVEQALQKALQRAPADRFATVTEFAGALERWDAPRQRAPFRRARAVALLGAAVLALAAWWAAAGRHRSAADLNPGVIAVLPFRVGGGPGVAYLRESMLDLLNARLTGEGGPRTVEPRTTLSAWRRMVRDETEDLPEEASRRLAARLGAGRLLLGSAIATPTELTLSGTLFRVSDGHVVAAGSVAGAADSVAVLVNRLTARLLSLEAGESRERLDGLASTTLDALQDYLAGQRAYRRGDYFAAMDLYASAFRRDSAFVQAAFGLVATNPLIGTVARTDGLLAIPTVWRLRDRLSMRDAALLRGMPFVGPNYPKPSTYAEIITQEENAAAQAPDSPEQWLQLGTTLSAYGAASSVSDWRGRAAEALDRAVALDSTFSPAVEQRLFLSTWQRDSAATRRLAPLMDHAVRLGYADGTMSWAAAVTLGDTAAARGWLRYPRDSSGRNYAQRLVKVALHSVQAGLPLNDARWSNATLRRAGATDGERHAAWLGEQAVAAADGSPSLADGFSAGDTPWGAASLIELALVEPAYRPLAAGVIARSDPSMYRVVARGSAVDWPPVRDCFVELFRVSGGDTSTTRAAVRRLRAFARLDPPPVPRETWDPIDFRVCPLLLETLLEGGHTRGGASRLDSLDALMRNGPRWLTLGPPATPVVAANWAIARLRASQGDYARAVAAIRRRESNYYPAYLWTLPAFLRQEGRLAALAGDTAGAAEAYDSYLVLRARPDAAVRAEHDSVVAERAALRRR